MASKVRPRPAFPDDFPGLHEADRWDMKNDVAASGAVMQCSRIPVTGKARGSDVHDPVRFDQDVFQHYPAACRMRGRAALTVPSTSEGNTCSVSAASSGEAATCS